MKTFGFLGALVAVATLPATQATWCKLYSDSSCSKSTSGDTSFDCGNSNVFGNSGRYVSCHNTKANSQACGVSRCTTGSCDSTTREIVSSDESCVDMKGKGPFYKLSLE